MTSLPSPPLLFIAFFTLHRSPLSERLEQAKPKLNSRKVRQTLSKLTLLPHQTKSAVPN